LPADKPKPRREAWDKKYVEVEDEVLFHLILAANFLDIKDLLDLTCKTVPFV